MSIALHRNIGAFIKSVLLLDHEQASDGAGPFEGSSVDRTGHLSAVFNLGINATLAGGATATATVQMQHSGTDAGVYTNYGDASTPFVITEAVTPDESGVLEFDIDLSAARAFVRPVVNIVFSDGADTAEIMGMLVLGPADQNPV